MLVETPKPPTVDAPPTPAAGSGRFSFTNTSIRVKLMILMAFSSSFALLLAGVSLLGYEAIQYRNGATRELTALADIVSASSTAALTFGDEAAARETLTLRLWKVELQTLANTSWMSNWRMRKPTVCTRGVDDPERSVVAVKMGWRLRPISPARHCNDWHPVRRIV
jgi:hypothetical protein